MYIKKLVGERLYLSPMNSDDYVKFTHWDNDNEIAMFSSNLSRPISFSKERDFLEDLSKDRLTFAIVDIDTDLAIGSIGFLDYSPLNRTSYYAIFIGDKNYWSKGYGTEATMLLLDFGFNVLNLNNVMLEVMAINNRAISCYKKCGFKEFGRRHEATIMGDRKIDAVYMEILAKDFKGESFVYKLINRDIT